MVNSTALVVIDPHAAVAAAKARKDVVVALTQGNILRPNIDFGIVPGSQKPSLLKPGAERLCAAFGLDPRFETLTSIEDWNAAEPLFFYRILCRLIHIESGLEVATGIGSCNSRESKYRWRWVTEDRLPPGENKAALETKVTTVREPVFAIERAETSGQYGKPAAYWQQFKDAIEAGTARKVQMPKRSGGTMDGWEIGGTLYRVPNDDVFSLVNTIEKIACKRALVAATLIGANASEFFTQDIEDMPGFGLDADEGDVVEASFTVVTGGQSSEPPAAPKNGRQTATPGSYRDNPGALYNAVLKTLYDGNTHHMKGSIEKAEREGALTPDMTVEQATVALKQRKLAKALAQQNGVTYQAKDTVTLRTPEAPDKPDMLYTVTVVQPDGRLALYADSDSGAVNLIVDAAEVQPATDVKF